MKKWILISVIDREIMTEECETLLEAQGKMKEELNTYADPECDEYELEETGGWANGNDGDIHCDWKIIQI
jgi:hypothetical protein